MAVDPPPSRFKPLKLPSARSHSAVSWVVLPPPTFKPASIPAPPKIKIVEKIVERPTFKRHSVGGFVGFGPDGLDVEKDGDDKDVTEDFRFALGASYGYNFNLNWSAHILGTTNRSVLGGVKYHFD